MTSSAETTPAETSAAEPSSVAARSADDTPAPRTPAPGLSVSDALASVLEGVHPLAAETCAVAEAHGRVLADDLEAVLSNPPRAVSAMDGYAVRSVDLPVGDDDAGGKPPLTLTGERVAGDAAPTAEDHLAEQSAVRIFTGAPVPAGADVVLAQEDVERCGDQLLRAPSAASGTHIRPEGADFAAGSLLFERGSRLTARGLVLAATAGVMAVPARCRPRVGLLATGDELVAPGRRPEPGQIVSSTPLGLGALVVATGGVPIDLGIARDRMEDLEAALARTEGLDVLVTIGGASVGERDLVRKALEAAGFDLAFWRLAMRPGKPLFMARRGRLRVMGLPGNPVSSLICARVFLVPLMRALLGQASAPGQAADLLRVHWPSRTARLSQPIDANGPRHHFMRATLSGGPTSSTRDGGPDGGAQTTEEHALRSLPLVRPAQSQDSGRTQILASSDVVISRAPFAPALGAGALVEIHDLDF